MSALRGAISRSASGIAGASGGLGWGLATVGLAGAALLLLSEFTTVTDVKLGAAVLPGSAVDGLHQNAGAMLILGTAALPMLYVAARAASRPAMTAVLLIGIIGLLIALVGDLPDVTRAGTILRERYEDAEAEPQIGFTFEVLGAALLVVTGGAMLVAIGGSTGRRESRPGDDPANERS